MIKVTRNNYSILRRQVIFANILIIALLSILLCSCSSNNGKYLSLKNDTDLLRLDEPIVVKRSIVEQICGKIADAKLPIVKTRNGVDLPSQTDDIDDDGKWDELAFLYSFKPKEEIKVKIVVIDSSNFPEYKIRTNIRLGVSEARDNRFKDVTHEIMPRGYVTSYPTRYQMESVSWENDLMAFRNYFDIRNSKDLYGKLTQEMILDKVGINENYHKLQKWGMDILHVGNSLGAGGLAFYENDSLYRLGNTDFTEFDIVSEGPVRSILDLNFEGWNVEGKTYQARERITIWAGHYWFKSDVTVTDFKGEKQLVIGIVNSRYEGKLIELKPNNCYSGIATHGNQTEIKDTLGMAIILKSDELVGIGEAPKGIVYKVGTKKFERNKFRKAVSETYYVKQRINSGIASSHYFFAAWGRQNPKMNKKRAFLEMVELESNKFNNPIIIKTVN